MIEKKPDNTMLMISLVGIILTIIAIYISMQKRKIGDPGSGGYTGGGGSTGPNDPVVPGQPAIWELSDSVPTPSRNLIFRFSRPVHVSTLSGAVNIVDPHPGYFFPPGNIGFSLYVTQGGIRKKLASFHPNNGFGVGTASLSATIGLSNITAIEIYKDIWYGLPLVHEDRLKFDSGQISALVIA